MDLSPAALSHNLALFQSQVLGSLFGTSTPGKGDLFSTLLSQRIANDDNGQNCCGLPGLGADVGGLSGGRNLALFDPESAYRMMSLINNRDVLYKAQFAELSEMKARVAQMHAAGQGLACINADTPDAGIAALLGNFVERYNHWRESFNADVETGGLLDNMQAAEVSLYELEQSVKNIFFGAKDGLHGLRDLGIAVDPATHLATFDGKQLSATLAGNRQAAVNAIQEFSANFAKSASLLNAENNFIPNQLANLNRVIRYIHDNRASLIQEFGTGDAAKPSGKVAQALAAYGSIAV